MERNLIVDLDQWAEDKFSSLCSSAGVTRNKSLQDRTGWDYLVEFPPAASKELPADLRPTDQSARVQVKSKRSGKARVTLKLSNALRFAKDPLPCFIVLFLETERAAQVRIFARHFWKEEIGHSLKRAREAHAQGREDLNNLSITLSFNDQDERKDDLLKWMRDSIVSQSSNYSQIKAELAQTIGFEDGSFHGNISIDKKHIEALVDHQIGLTPFAPPLKITFNQSRFGIDMSTPIFEGAPDFASMKSHSRPCRVRVRGSAGDDIWLDGGVFFPGLPDLPPELLKVRVVADFIEILFTEAQGSTVKFNIRSDTQRSLLNLWALAKAHEAAKAGPIQIQISIDGKVLFEFVSDMKAEQLGDHLRNISEVIESLERASRGLLSEKLTLSLDDIFDAWNEIVRFHGMIAGTNMRGNFKIDREVPNVGPVTSVFYFDYVDIGRWTFLAVVRRPIRFFELKGTEGLLECDDARIVEAIVRRGKSVDHLREIRDLYDRAIEFEGATTLALGDYRKFA